MKLLLVPSSRAYPRRFPAAAGSTLAATMLVVAAIVSFLSIAALITSQFGRYAGRQQGVTDASAGCDAALEYAYGQWKTAVAASIGGVIPAASACGPAPASPNPMYSQFNNVYGGSGGFAKSGVVCPTPAAGALSTLRFEAVDDNGQLAADRNGNVLVAPLDIPPKIKTYNVPGYPGWTGYTYNYKATATVANPNHFGALGGGTTTTSRYFKITRVPLFQAAIFYENTLEIHPGAKMVVTGLVHSNDKIYALGYLATLQFMGNVSYVGSFSDTTSNPVVQKGWDGSNTNKANIPDTYASYFPVYYSDNLPSTTSAARASQINQVSPIDPFGGANTSNNGLHDTIEVPPTGNTSDQYAYNNAALVVTVDSTKLATDPTRILITSGPSGAPMTTSDITAVQNALTILPQPITDMREGSTNVTLTNLDMGKLAAATVPASGNGDAWQASFAKKPTVYIHDVGATTATQRRAIRLVDGYNLGQNVSVASDNGVYIQGDYNTGGSATNKPDSDGANATTTSSPTVSGATRYSSAVMADAVTILSNNWSDSYSNNPLYGQSGGSSTVGRVASATTVNTAIMAGDVPSNNNGNGIASGGAHNFPRFLENWSGKNFTYYGSLVQAFRSEKYTGNWQTNNVYTWPNRLWNFDTNFIDNPPAGAPTGMQFSRGRWERSSS